MDSSIKGKSSVKKPLTELKKRLKIKNCHWLEALRLHYIRLFPDPRFLLFVLQNIAGYKNAVECLLQ